MNFDEARKKAQEKQMTGSPFGGNQSTSDNNFEGQGTSNNAFDNDFNGSQNMSGGNAFSNDSQGSIPDDSYFTGNQSTNNNAFDNGEQNQGTATQNGYSRNDYNSGENQGTTNGNNERYAQSQQKSFQNGNTNNDFEPQVSSAIQKAREKYQEEQLDGLDKNYDTGFTPEQEQKLTEYFGEVNKSFHQSDAILETVVPFKADPQSRYYENQRSREGHAWLLRFKSINPYTNAWESGFRLMLQTTTVTKETANTDNKQYEVKPETVEKMNYLVNLVFGKYGIHTFNDLPKMNMLVQQNNKIEFKVYWREQTINQRAMVQYALTNHSRANFIQTEKVDERLAMLVNQYGKLINGTTRVFPAKIVMLRDNVNFRRFELALEVDFPNNGGKHYYGKTFNYNQRTDNQGRKIVDFHEFSKFPPDMVQKQSQIFKLKNLTRIGYKDFNIISQRNFIPVNFTVEKSQLRDKNGCNILYIDFV